MSSIDMEYDKDTNANIYTSSQVPDSSSYGRVVRLHFACRAELPIGSSLRVTSSQLWAPGMNTPTDPNGAKMISAQASESALPDNQIGDDANGTGARGGVGVGGRGGGAANGGSSVVGSAGDGWSPSVQESYASSVEMVTSPDEWPVWRTRKPVVISLRHHHGRVEHHRYRYMIVNPGANGNVDNMDDTDGGMDMMDDLDENISLQGSPAGGGCTTNDDMNAPTEVMRWEDPFQGRQSQKDLLNLSSASLPSVRRNAITKTLSNLPYRTVGVDTVTTKVQQSPDESASTSGTASSANDFIFTPCGEKVHVDTWNRAQDFSFVPYVLREQMNKQNKAKKQLILSQHSFSGYGNTNTGDAETGGGIASPRMNTKVSFSNLVDVAIETNAQGQGSNPISSTTSLTVTPNPSSVLSLVSKQVQLAKPKTQRIFFVCFHLPVILTHDVQTEKWNATWAESLLAATEGSQVCRDYEPHWIGTVDCSSHPIQTQQDRDAVEEVLAKMQCTPLFLDKDTQDAHYLGMCKQVLWPAFHNVDLLDLNASGVNRNTSANVSHPSSSGNNDSDWDQSRLDFWWKAYQEVNQAFADMLATFLKPGDVMWVHDYHLSLLPKLIDDRERADIGRSVTKKVFLLHIPFPTSQIFRELECGEEILKGVLHADVVGFHAFDHARHFLNATKRILGLNHESLIGGLIGIKIGRKTVLVTMHNVSIEPYQMEAALSLPSVKEYAAKLRHDHSSRTIISGIDICQRLSGISLKLLAFEKLLMDYPVWQEKVVMIQKCLLPGSRSADEATTVREVRQMVKRIKDKFGPNVIDYQEIYGSSLPIDQRLALWKASNVLMTTPIREGLNLLPLEYVYARKKPSTPGVVISSEFSVVSNVLNGALRVNPFDIQMSVTCIDKALTMTQHEKTGRRCRDETFVTSCTSSQWTKSVLNDLYDATAAIVSDDDDDSEDTSIVGTKFDKTNLITSTSGFLAHEKDIAFSHLDINSVVSAYQRTNNRVLLLDLNGTIIIKEPPGKYLKREILGSSGFDVNPEVSKALTRLCADPRNTVFVVSGDSQENVMKAIGDIPSVGVAASNGACFAPPLKHGDSKRQWKYFDLGVDWAAVKKIVLPILAKYTARSNGSFVKLTHSSIGWSYYSCDPEWGSMQASHLVLELENELRAFDVRFVMIKGIVEVVPRRLNKGLIAKNVLREVENYNRSRGNTGVDFVLCMGDDVQDEKMFTSVFSFIAEQDNPVNAEPSPRVIDEFGKPLPAGVSYDEGESNTMEDGDVSKAPLYAFTAVVGKKQSHAFTYVDDARDVSTLLLKLAGMKGSTLSDEAMAGIGDS